LNPRPLGYEPNELPDCSTPRQGNSIVTLRRSGVQPRAPGCAGNGSTSSFSPAPMRPSLRAPPTDRHPAARVPPSRAVACFRRPAGRPPRAAQPIVDTRVFKARQYRFVGCVASDVAARRRGEPPHRRVDRSRRQLVARESPASLSHGARRAAVLALCLDGVFAEQTCPPLWDWTSLVNDPRPIVSSGRCRDVRRGSDSSRSHDRRSGVAPRHGSLSRPRTIANDAGRGPVAGPILSWRVGLVHPLLPGLVAAVSSLTGQPVHVSAARAGAYLNLAAPIAFYLLVFRLVGPACALASLVGFLFVVRGPTWATPTYSPWLYASVFAQTFFYLTLAAYSGAITLERRWLFVLTGVLLGVTFLTHTAPAILARRGHRGHHRVPRGRQEAHRPRGGHRVDAHGGSRHPRGSSVSLVDCWPLSSAYPESDSAHLVGSEPAARPLAAQIAPRPLLNTMIVVGFAAVCLSRLRRPARSIVTVWLGASILLFVYSNYVVPGLPGALSPIVPAHRFLIYERAAEIVIFGLGVTVTASGVGWMIWRAIGSRFGTTDCGRVRHATFALGCRDCARQPSRLPGT
jgi:hypothetical protein